MHESVMQWLAERLYHALDEAWGKRRGGARFLELGSRNVNGSARDLLDRATPPGYIGIDLVPGRDVDIQARAAWLPLPDKSFDIVLSTEMLEHDLTFWFSLEEAWRVLRWGGHLIVTARGFGFPRHDHPDDFYRFSPRALGLIAKLYGFVSVAVYEDPQFPGVFLHARKRVVSEGL